MKSTFAVIASLAAYGVQAIELTNTVFNPSAGKEFVISWQDAKGPVSLELRNGKSGDLKFLAPIAAGIQPNPDGTGSFPWTVPTELAGEGQYAIVITDTPAVPNYSEQFDISGIKVTGSTAEPTSSDLEDVTTSVTSHVSALSTSTAEDSALAESTSSSSFKLQTMMTTSPNATSTSTHTPTTSNPKATGKGPDDDENSPKVPDAKAASLASPLALIMVSIAAMFYLH